jgi:6,7-dimethyl-8-ribityllumazine synthase
MTETSRILIVAGDFYTDIADALIDGATIALETCDIDVMRVPGAFEIPGVIAMAARSDAPYDGYIGLGCVIRGETSHYDYVCGESARGLMELSLEGHAIGNGILTVENREQALVRAIKKNKGRDAAQACLAMIAAKKRFLGES